MTRYHDPDWLDPHDDDDPPAWRSRAELSAAVIEKLAAAVTVLISARAHYGSWRGIARAALRHITRN
jgi:hypothetical protein